MNIAIPKLHPTFLRLLTILVTILVIVRIVCGSGQPLLVAVGGLGGVGVVMALTYRRWSLLDLCYLGMIVIILRTPMQTRWGLDLVGDVLFVLAMGIPILCWLVAGLSGKISRPFTGNGPFVSLLVVFAVGWIALSCYTAVDRSISTRTAMGIPLMLLWGHWVVPAALRKDKDVERVLRFFVYAAIVIVVFTTVTWLVPVHYRGRRLGWWGPADYQARLADANLTQLMATGGRLPVAFLGHPNAMAAFLVLCIGPTVYFLFKSSTRRSRVWLSLLLGAITVYIILSGARLSLAAAILSGLVFAYLYSKRTFAYAVLVVLLLSFVVFSAVYVVTYKYGIFFTGHQIVSKFFKADVTSGRLEIWAGAIDNIKSRPWLGLGLQGAHVLRKRNLLLAGFSTAHNGYLELAEESGVPLLLWLLLYIGTLMTTAWRIYAYHPSRRLLGAAFLAIFAAILFHLMGSIVMLPIRFQASGAAVLFLAGAMLALESLAPQGEPETLAANQNTPLPG